MDNRLLPANDAFVDTVAKAIAKGRMYRDASLAMKDMIGVGIEDSERLESTFDRIFDSLWSGTSAQDENQKNLYRDDARAAISAINLKLLTSPE